MSDSEVYLKLDLPSNAMMDYNGEVALSPKSVAVENLKFFIKDSLKDDNLFNDSLNLDNDEPVSSDSSDLYLHSSSPSSTANEGTTEELLPPLKTSDITKNDRLWNKNLNSLDIPSDSDGTGSVSSNDTMILINTDLTKEKEFKHVGNLNTTSGGKGNPGKKKKNVTFNLDLPDRSNSVKVKRVTFADSVVDNSKKQPVKDADDQSNLSAVERLMKNKSMSPTKNEPSKSMPSFKKMNEALRKEMKKEDEKSSFSINDRLKLLTMSRKDRMAALGNKMNEGQGQKSPLVKAQIHEDISVSPQVEHKLASSDEEDDDEDEGEIGNSTYEIDDILDALDEDTSGESNKDGSAEASELSKDGIKGSDALVEQTSHTVNGTVNVDLGDKAEPLRDPGTLYQKSNTGTRSKSLSSSNIDTLKPVHLQEQRPHSEYATYAEIMSMLRDKARPKGLHNALLTSSLLRSSSTSSLASDTQSQSSNADKYFQSSDQKLAANRSTLDKTDFEDRLVRKQRHWYDDLDQDSNASSCELDNEVQGQPLSGDLIKTVDVLDKPYRGFLYSNTNTQTPATNIPTMSYLNLAPTHPYKSRQELKAMQNMSQSGTSHVDQTAAENVIVCPPSNDGGQRTHDEHQLPGSLSNPSNMPLPKLTRSPTGVNERIEFNAQSSVDSKCGSVVSDDQYMASATSVIPTATQSTSEQIYVQSGNGKAPSTAATGPRPLGIRQLPAKVTKPKNARLGLRILPAISNHEEQSHKSLSTGSLVSDQNSANVPKSPHEASPITESIQRPPVVFSSHQQPFVHSPPGVKSSPTSVETAQTLTIKSADESGNQSLGTNHPQLSAEAAETKCSISAYPATNNDSSVKQSHLRSQLDTNPTHMLDHSLQSVQDKTIIHNFQSSSTDRNAMAYEPSPSHQQSAYGNDQYSSISGERDEDQTRIQQKSYFPAAHQSVSHQHQPNGRDHASPYNLHYLPHGSSPPGVSHKAEKLPHAQLIVPLGRRDSFQQSRSNLRPSVGYASSSKINEMYFGGSLRKGISDAAPQLSPTSQQENRFKHHVSQDVVRGNRAETNSEGQHQQQHQELRPDVNHYDHPAHDHRHNQPPSTLHDVQLSYRHDPQSYHQEGHYPQHSQRQQQAQQLPYQSFYGERTYGHPANHYRQQPYQEQHYQSGAWHNQQSQWKQQQQQQQQQQHQYPQYRQQPPQHFPQSQTYQQQPPRDDRRYYPPSHPEHYHGGHQYPLVQYQPRTHDHRDLRQQPHYQDQAFNTRVVHRQSRSVETPYITGEGYRTPAESGQDYSNNHRVREEPMNTSVRASGHYDRNYPSGGAAPLSQEVMPYYYPSGESVRQVDAARTQVPSSQQSYIRPGEAYENCNMPRPRLVRKPSNGGTFIQVYVDNPPLDTAKVPPDWERGAPEGASSSPRSSNDSDKPFFVDTSQRSGVKVSEL